MPLSQINLGLRKGVYDPDYPGLVSTAEVSTIQLEFRYLSYLTDDDIYWEKVERVRVNSTVCLYLYFDLFQVMAVIKGARAPHGLASIFMKSFCLYMFPCSVFAHGSAVPMKANSLRLPYVLARVGTHIMNIYCEKQTLPRCHLLTLML